MSSELPGPDSNGMPAQPSGGPEMPTVENEIVNAEAADPNPPMDASQVGLGVEMSYLHPTSLMFDLIAHGRTYLVPAAFGLWGAAKGDLTLLIISALIFVPAFLFSVFRYFTFRYCIEGDQLIVRQGLIFRNVRTVPVSRIQNIDFVQNPLHRILSVAEVKVETASGTKPEATLRVLSMAKMESLRNAVFGGLNKKAATSLIPGSSLEPAGFVDELAQSASGFDREYLAENELKKTETTTILEIPVSWLVKAALASNRGLIMIGVMFGLYFQYTSRTNFDLGQLRLLVPEDASTPVIIAAAIGSLIGALILLRLLGIGWFILRFHGYKLARRGDDLRISCGLLTKVSATVPRQRIQFISIHRSLIMRLFSMASIRIETAGGDGSESENATESVSKRWFVPAIPESEVSNLISALRPELNWDESNLDFRPLAEKTARRLCRLACFQAVIFAGAGLLISRPWGWLLGIVLLPFLLMWAIKKSKAMRYARMENGVVYRSGVFIRKTSATFFEKIQTLSVDQSPFDRRWKMAKLSVDIAAAGPADHRIHVPYLDENFAREELQLLRQMTGQEQPVFG